MAGGAAPDFITRITAGEGLLGSGAGEVNHPRAIAGNPNTGHVYVSDLSNARINEYTAWGFFVKSWGWGVASGASEFQTCGPPTPEEAPSPTLCQSGSEGSGRGQLHTPLGMTVDGAGNVYVLELENLRIQKFSAAGQFLLMFGGKVNRTKIEEAASAQDQNLCPVHPADVCQAGTSGAAPSHLAGTIGNYIAYSEAANAIVVGDKDRVQIFNLDGTYREAIPFQGELAAFDERSVNGLDVDGVGNIYLTFSSLEGIYKLSPSGVPLEPGKPGGSAFGVVKPLAVAVDGEGSVYAIEDEPTPKIVPEVSVVKFDATGEKLVPTKAEEEAGQFFPFVAFQGPQLNGIATNLCVGSEKPGNLYVAAFRAGSVSYVDAYGTGPIGCEPPPERPPTITAQYVTSATDKEATLQAQINPRFWSDATYYVEYGTGKCSEGACTAKAPVPAALLTSKSTNKAVKTAQIFLSGLESGRTYYYRFTAESSGGGPVLGDERRFTTFKTSGPIAPCENDAFRVGPSGRLPDCRAYEMVSPLDKQNGDVALFVPKSGSPPNLFELHQSSTSGDQFTFSSSVAFAEPESAPYVSQYLAGRMGLGWLTDSISSPRSEPAVQADALAGEYQLFSPDLCTAWLRHNSVAPLLEAAIEGFPNLYRRENCGEPLAYEVLTTIEPPKRDPDEYDLRTFGASADGTHTVFVANDKLHPDAPTLKEGLELLLYEQTPEGLRFVCYLPSGSPSPEACAAGTGAGTGGGNESSVHNAISADGRTIFWTAYSGDTGFGDSPGAPGQIYARIDGQRTIGISGPIATTAAWYWTAANDGSKVIFAFDGNPVKDQLYEFDVDAETSSMIAGEVEGPMGASEDASRIYFASREDLDDGGPASAGAHNLYLYDAMEASFTFIMVLAAADIGGSKAAPGPVDDVPAQRSARISADGLHATFSSVASPPNGYDNIEASSGEPAQEVYHYDAEAQKLSCISCNPSGARPVAEQVERPNEPFWVASRIQGWEVLGHAPRVMSEDGARVFFESLEALVPRDTNGTWDVYQWEALGKGSCRQADPTFGEASGGCVSLISSGESSAVSTFLDADLAGDSIFIATQSSLVEADYGLNDVYVARVDGGFPERQVKPECEGEACQSPPPPPELITPASSAYRGPGNPPLSKLKRGRCPKGKRRVRRSGKARCVKRRASHHRRAGR